MHKAAFAFIFVLLAGCVSTDVRTPENAGPLLAPSEVGQGLSQQRPKTYLKRNSSHNGRFRQKVSIETSGMPLARVLSTVAPDLNVRVTDAGVDLGQSTALYVSDMPLHEFLKQLTDISGYHFEIAGNTVRVSSEMTKVWNLATLSANRQTLTKVGGDTGISDPQNQQGQGGGGGFGGGGGGGLGGGGGGGLSNIGGGGGAGGGNQQNSSGTVVQSTYEQDDWETLLEDIKEFVGLEGSSTSNGQVKVVAVRTLGTVSVTGPPKLVSSVDDFLGNIVEKSQQQVHLDVKAFEVAIEDNRARGINWQAILNTTIDGGPFQAVFSSVNDANIEGPSGQTQVGGNFQNGDDQITALINLLGRHGDVELLTEPNLTTLNGDTAYISSVDEFSFVSSVTQFISNQGTNTITPTLARIRVGVSMAVTPRVLDDDRVLIEVTPVISSLQGFDQFSVGDFDFQNPRIALSELTTQVITRPGQPVQLGGLITSRISEALNRLPTSNRGGLLDLIFGSESNELERRELVLTITPTLTEA